MNIFLSELLFVTLNKYPVASILDFKVLIYHSLNY